MKEKIKVILIAMYSIGHADGMFRPKTEHTKDWVVPDIFADEIMLLYDEEYCKSVAMVNADDGVKK